MSLSVSFSFQLPDEMLTSILSTLQQNEKIHNLKQSTLLNKNVDTKIRSSKNTFISSKSWFVGMLYYYADLVNQRVYQFDITGYESDSVQYAEYTSGDFYSWHSDDLHQLPTMCNYVPSTVKPKLPSPTEYVRKLSYSFQLNDDYTGGELQLYEPHLGKVSLETIPKQKGLLTIFDSRTLHRVRKVKSGTRKSIVGWLVGPRWR